MVLGKMSHKGHRFATVAAFLLIAVALLSTCGTSLQRAATLEPTPTATTLATPTLEPAAAAPPTAPPSPSPEIDFPLALGNTWVFQLTRYEGVPISEIIITTSVVTETVVEVNNPSSYLVAKVHRQESAETPVGEVPPGWQDVPLRRATSSEYWLVLSENRMYRQEGNFDLSSLNTALLEFVFPLELGDRWYQSGEKAKLNPTYADDWMLRKVTQIGAVAVPAGAFENCFFLEETWAGTEFETWFCPGVGVVDRKSDPHGTPGGFREVLIQYQLTPPVLAGEGLIAFVDPEGRLSLIELDGQSQRQLTTGGEAFAPAWSRDGETLAYVYQEKAEEPRRASLYRLDTGQTELVGAPKERLRSLAWSPDGRYLLLDSGTSMAGQIAIVEVASRQTVHESLTAVGFAWSPDGQRLALGQLQPLEDPISVESGDSVSLAVLEVGTGTPRVVLTGTSEVLYFPRAWLPDGRLLYDRLDWDEDAGTGEHSRWTVTIDDLVSTPEPAANVPPAFDREVTLARLPEAYRNESTGSFSWSPDGRWLVFHTRLGREMGVYVFDWEQGGEPVRLIDGTSPAWRPAEVSQRPAVLSEGTLDCVPAGTFSHCVDDVLGIEFEVPASWGPIETRLRPGLDAGFAYDYYFDGKAHAETEPLVAGGRSVDFSEGRGAMPTDFGGYEHPGLSGTSACDSRWNNSYPLCRKVSANVAWMIRFPNASVLCEDVLGNWQTMPVFRIEISLSDNPTINGFVFEAPFFSEQFAGRVQDELYPLLGARLDWRASKCDETSREAFDAQLQALIETIANRTADAKTLENVDELVHLAESIRCQE